MNACKKILTRRFILDTSGRASCRFRQSLSLSIFLGALFTFAAHAQYSPPTSGLVSWWQAEGNAHDSADGNNGILLNGGYAPGVFGSAFSFDGINGHVRVADNANLRLTSALTLGAWVNLSSYGNYNEILGKWDIVGGIDQRSYTFAIHPNGEAYLTLSGSGTDFVVGIAFSTNAIIPLNTWTHLAGSYDGSFVRIYVNGVLKGQTAYSSGIFSGTDDLGIGGDVGGGSLGEVLSSFAGRIDEAVIYNRALSGNEIVTLATVPEPSALALFLLGFTTVLLKGKPHLQPPLIFF